MGGSGWKGVGVGVASGATVTYTGSEPIPDWEIAAGIWIPAAPIHDESRIVRSIESNNNFDEVRIINKRSRCYTMV